MTPFFFQKELVEAVKDAVADLRFKKIDGEYIPLNVYEQNIPISENDDTEEEPFPYILCRVVGGEHDPYSEGYATIHSWIIVGIFNDDVRDIGHQDVLGVMQRISERLCKSNILPHFRVDGKISWKVQETGTYPFFYGGMEMDFVGTAIRHQDYREGELT